MRYTRVCIFNYNIMLDSGTRSILFIYSSIMYAFDVGSSYQTQFQLTSQRHTVSVLSEGYDIVFTYFLVS